MSFSSSLPRECIPQIVSRDSSDLPDIDEDEVSNSPPPRPTVVTLPSHAGNVSDNEDDDEDDDIFAMDEENIGRKKKKNRLNSKYVPSDDDEEDENVMMRGSRAYSVSGRVGAGVTNENDDGDNDDDPPYRINNSVGPLAYGTSLPITIPGRFWPPEEATDSFSADENGDQRQAMTILPQRGQDLYSMMRDQARSIQAPDNPERLFGERPRRRHQTGENTHPVVTMHITDPDGNSPPVISTSVKQ